MNDSLAVVLTAGGCIDRAEFVMTGPPEHYLSWTEDEELAITKAFLIVQGRALLEIVLDAVRNTGLAEKVVVVGVPEMERWLHAPHEVLIADRGTAHENLIVGLEAVAEFPRVLYLTTDLPFVTAEAVSAFVQACPRDAQICYGIVRREVFDRRFPNSPSTYARLRDGSFVAGCAAMVEPPALLNRAEWIHRAAQRRKSLFRLAMLAGPRVVWKYLTRQLTVADVERRAEHLLGMRCRAVECPPELAYDIDTPEEYFYAVRFVDARPH